MADEVDDVVRRPRLARLRTAADRPRHPPVRRRAHRVRRRRSRAPEDAALQLHPIRAPLLDLVTRGDGDREEPAAVRPGEGADEHFAAVQLRVRQRAPQHPVHPERGVPRLAIGGGLGRRVDHRAEGDSEQDGAEYLDQGVAGAGMATWWAHGNSSSGDRSPGYQRSGSGGSPLLPGYPDAPGTDVRPSGVAAPFHRPHASPPMRFRHRDPEVVLGLDLSPGRAKLVCLTPGPDGPIAVCAADRPISTRAGGAAHFDPAVIGAELAGIVASLRVRPRRVALCLGTTDATTRRVSLVAQAAEQMAAALSLQLAPALGAGVAAPRVAFVPLGTAAAGRQTVLASAARPEAAAAHQRAVVAAGLEPGPVTSAAVALLNAWGACGPAAEEQRVVLLHVGESAALWIVLDGGEPVALDAPLVGLAAARGRSDLHAGAGTVAEAALVEWAIRLRQEIERGLQQIRRERGGEEPPPYRVWVTGGAARTPGFLQALRAALSVPVELFDPVEVLGLECGEETFGPALAPAVGAALQVLSPPERRGAPALEVDLSAPLSDGEARDRIPLPVLGRRVARDPAYRGLAAAVLLAWLLTTVFERRAHAAGQELGERAARLEADSAAVAGAMAATQLIDGRRQAIGARVAAVTRLEHARGTWPRLLGDLATAVPDDAWVSSVSEEGGDPGSGAVRYRVRGYAASESVAADFARRLSSTGSARVERTARVRIGRATATRFEIAGTAHADGER